MSRKILMKYFYVIQNDMISPLGGIVCRDGTFEGHVGFKSH